MTQALGLSPETRGCGAGAAALRSLLNDLNTSAGALAALAAAMNARASGFPLAPNLEQAVHGVLDVLGVRLASEQLPLAELRATLAEIQVYAASHQQLTAPELATSGWTPASADLIQAAGEVSAGLPRLLERLVVPRLDGLAERLGAPGGRFLDVGAGAGALSIQMARTWPELAIVGIEPWAPALELARTRVRAAGLERRIELRAASGEGLADEASYDLGWIPSLFIAEPVLDAVLARVNRALRPGAWLILPVLRAEAASLASSVVRLRAALWGGSAPSLGDAAARLAATGFVDLQSFSSAPSSTTGLLAGRKRR
jgi:predicted O-methyltransferase YrrM